MQKGLFLLVVSALLVSCNESEQYDGSANGDKSLSQTQSAQTCLSFSDRAIGDYAASNWDVNRDGCVSTDEAAAVTSIPANAFAGNTSIASLDDLKQFSNLTSIGDGAFAGCTNLKSANLSSVTSVGDSAFKDCTNLTEANMPNASNVASNAFDGCTKLNQSVVCPSSCPNDCDANGVCNLHVVCPAECPDDCDADGVCNQHVVCPAGCANGCDADGNCNPVDICPSSCPNDCDANGVCNLHVVCPAECPDDCDADGVCNQHVVCPPGCANGCDADGNCNPVDICPSSCPNDCDANGVCNNHQVTCPTECPHDCDSNGVCLECPFGYEDGYCLNKGVHSDFSCNIWVNGVYNESGTCTAPCSAEDEGRIVVTCDDSQSTAQSGHGWVHKFVCKKQADNSYQYELVDFESCPVDRLYNSSYGVYIKGLCDYYMDTSDPEYPDAYYSGSCKPVAGNILCQWDSYISGGDSDTSSLYTGDSNGNYTLYQSCDYGCTNSPKPQCRQKECPSECLNSCDADGKCPGVCSANEALVFGNCVKIGDIVKFGRYRQSDTSDTPEDLEWIVLNIKNDAALLITKYVIDYKKYEPYYTNHSGLCAYAYPGTPTSPDCQPNWRDSLIRSWLNALGANSNKDKENFESTGFIKTAFTDAERAKIQTVRLNTPFAVETVVGIDDAQHSEWSTIDLDTEDKVFLLSTALYQSSDSNPYGYSINSYTLPGDMDLIHAYSTPYAYSQVKSDDIYKGVGLPEENIYYKLVDSTNCLNNSHYCIMAWWLRDVLEVDKAGLVDLEGHYVDYPRPAIDIAFNAGVRPVLWLKADNNNNNSCKCEGYYGGICLSCDCSVIDEKGYGICEIDSLDCNCQTMAGTVQCAHSACCSYFGYDEDPLVHSCN